ncbi:DUF6522 family protein [Aquamicrobium ahrensii]|uniref:Uncharacterized protein n=1 Tax=Aquamicrobium ahrensii TaxID=469551 RepID=A0ABV2KH52_9HYPH
MTAFVGRPVVARDTAGAFTLDADMLAGHFGWPPETLRDFMRRGMVASTVERGEGEDQGKWRLTVRCGNRRWQAIVEPDGAVVSEHVEFVPLRTGKTASL